MLYELHHLDIVDKHRELIIAGGAQQSVIFDVVLRVKKAARTNGIGVKVAVPFEIAYNDGTDSYGEPLLPKMEAMVNEIESVLAQL